MCNFCMTRACEQGPIWCLEFSQSGRHFATGGKDGSACIWRVTAALDAAERAASAGVGVRTRRRAPPRPRALDADLARARGSRREIDERLELVAGRRRGHEHRAPLAPVLGVSDAVSAGRDVGDDEAAAHRARHGSQRNTAYPPVGSFAPSWLRDAHATSTRPEP